MRELFPGFNHNPNFSDLWDNCVFVLDTNVLLRLYEYPEYTTDNILNFLEHEEIRDKLWLPHQVALEYQKNRLKVIWKQEKFYNEMINFLNDYSNDISNLKKKFNKRSELLQSEHRHLNITDIFGSVDQVIDNLLGSLKEIKNSIETKKNEDSKLSDDDIIESRLNKLFGEHNIGKPYDKDRVNEIYVESKFRYKNEIPPAFRDEKDGDLILWFQILDFAKKNDAPVIFVTDDFKEDWWSKKDNGDLIGPHPFLIQEFSCKTKQIFHMYRPKRFLEYLQQYIEDIEMDPKTITDVSTFKPSIMPLNQLIMPNEVLKNLNPALMVPRIDISAAMAEMSRQANEMVKASLAMNSLQHHIIDLSSVNRDLIKSLSQPQSHYLSENNVKKENED